MELLENKKSRQMSPEEKAAREMLVPFLGRIPVEPEIVNRGDSGIPLAASSEYPEITHAFEEICKEWNNLLEEKEIRSKQSAKLGRCHNE